MPDIEPKKRLRIPGIAKSLWRGLSRGGNSGVRSYEKVVRELADEESRRYFLESMTIRTTFLGITPETTIDPVVGRSEELVSVLDLSAPSLRLFSRNEPWVPSLINIQAVARVAKVNSDLFPREAWQDTERWLFSNPTEWDDFGFEGESLGHRNLRVSRYGVLSGFPAHSAQVFEAFTDLFINVRSNLPEWDDRALIVDYRDHSIERTPEVIKKVVEVLRKGKPDITDAEISLYLSTYPIMSDVIGGYKGFDIERDLAFVASQERIYYESGIEDVVERLRKSLG